MNRPYNILCDDSHPDWKQLRHKYITASSVAALAGQSPWSDRAKVIAEKRLPFHEVPEFRTTRNMWHGRYDEGHNMRKFSEITGIRCRNVNLFLESTKYPALACTLDGLCRIPEVLGAPEEIAVSGTWLRGFMNRLEPLAGQVGLIEMKQTEAWYGKEWKTVPPNHYWIQVQTQLAVTGYPWGLLVARIGAADMKAFLVEADEEFQEELVELLADYRKEVGYDG